MVTYVVKWNDGGSNCCDHIEVYVQDECTGSCVYHGKVDCSKRRYPVFDQPGQKAFKLIRYDPDGEYLATTYLACTACN